MARDHQHNPDANLNAARIVGEAAATAEDTPADVQAAWEQWSQHIQNVDERGMTLLKAAFEAGWDAGSGEDGASAKRKPPEGGLCSRDAISHP